MKTAILSIVIVAGLIGLGFLIGSGNSTQDKSIMASTIVDGKQVVEIRAKGGYTPRRSVAKAGVPTILRFNTKGTFDCSSSIRIPSLNISKNLPPSGVTDIDVGSAKIGMLQGTCGMGMYPFEIDFQS